jgi:hypothetical protein
MADVAQLLVVAVNLVRIVTISAFPRMHFKMIACPALRRIHGARYAFDWISVKPDDPLFLPDFWLRVDDCDRRIQLFQGMSNK